MDLSQEVKDILNAAYQEAKNRKHEYLTPEHVLYAMLHYEYPRDVLIECGADPDQVRSELDKGSTFTAKIPLSCGSTRCSSAQPRVPST